MNRVIKFRAWDIESKKFRDQIPKIESWWDTDCWDDSEELMQMPFVNLDVGSQFSHRLVWQQYVGQKDLNGKEVYEGDIIKGEGKFQGQYFNPIDNKLKTSEGSYKWVGKIIWDNEYSQFLIEYISPAEYNGRGHFVGTVPWCEVIGNIYENPELLKST